MMVFSMVLDLILAAIAAAMLIKGHYGVTKQLAFGPLAVAVLDASFAGVITYGATPVLSGLLTLLQIVILGGSAVMLYQDRVHARNKQSRRRRRHEVLRTQAAFEQARGCHKQRVASVCA